MNELRTADFKSAVLILSINVYLTHSAFARWCHLEKINFGKTIILVS